MIEAYRHLAAAVLARAVRDAKSDNSHADDARRFLAGPWAETIADVLEVSDDLRQLVAGLPEPKARQLELWEL